MGDQKGALLPPAMIIEPNMEKKCFSFLTMTQPMKGHGLFVYYRSPNFLFLSIKVFSFPFYMETCMWLSLVADPELQFSGDPSKSIFAGEIPGRLFVSG